MIQVKQTQKGKEILRVIFIKNFYPFKNWVDYEEFKIKEVVKQKIK